MREPTEIFLSHQSQDQAFATRLGEVLREHGLAYWYSKRDIPGAALWHDENGEALARCDWFLLVLSPASVESEWVKRELLDALDQKRYVGHIVVLDYQPAESRKLSWTLRSFQWIDFQHDFADGCRELLRIWGRGYRG